MFQITSSVSFGGVYNVSTSEFTNLNDCIMGKEKKLDLSSAIWLKSTLRNCGLGEFVDCHLGFTFGEAIVIRPDGHGTVRYISFPSPFSCTQLYLITL